MEEKHFEELLNKYLIDGEEILWKGKPNIKMPIMIFVAILFYSAIIIIILEMESKATDFWKVIAVLYFVCHNGFIL